MPSPSLYGILFVGMNGGLMADRPMKLQDLFKTGEEIELDLGEQGAFKLYFRKPTPQQREEAVSIAKSKALRVKRGYRDKEADAHQGLISQVENLSHEELVENLLEFDLSDLRTAAYNEVLYGATGSDWSSEGLNYIDLVTAIRNRMQEIQNYNEALTEGEEPIEFHTDEELKGLMSDREIFENEVKDTVEGVVQEKRVELRGMTDETLISRWVNRSIELESNMAWYQEYRVNMLYHAVREVDDHDKLYFNNRSEIEELPFYISMQLHDHMDNIDRGVSELKNLLTPQPS